MRENRVRQRWQVGETVLNGWLAIPNSFSAETMAHQGWDSLTIDLQHGIVDYLSTVSMLQAISTTDVTPLVRVAWLDPGIIMKVLDAGAYGVICPMINDAADAEALVAACRYPPQGQRSFGPIRALLYAGADYPSHANESVIVLAMIETAKALANLDEILAVPHLDGVYVGPADLSNALGWSAELRHGGETGGRGDRHDPGQDQGAGARRRHPQRLDRSGCAARREGLPLCHGRL